MHTGVVISADFVCSRGGYIDLFEGIMREGEAERVNIYEGQGGKNNIQISDFREVVTTVIPQNVA